MQQHGRLSFSVRPRSAAAAAVVMLACSGCSTAPDARCLSSRPLWSSNDTQSIRAKKTAAAKRWDSQCTLVGVIRSAAAGR
jgi:hypothetical protein